MILRSTQYILDFSPAMYYCNHQPDGCIAALFLYFISASEHFQCGKKQLPKECCRI